MKNRYIGFFGLLLLCFSIFSQSFEIHPLKGAIYGGINNDTCYFLNKVVDSKILNTNPRFKKYLELQASNPEKARSFQNSLATSEIIINFTAAFEANLAAREAFRFAADMWEMEVVSSVPIIIEADLQPLGSGVIAQNGSPSVSNVPNSADPTVSYNTSLANSIAGVDLIPDQADLFQTYSSDFDFYYGKDANPGTRTDFVTIALHEIGHGMGISGSHNGSLGVGDNSGTNPRSWDTFAELGNGTSILSLGFGTQEQQDALVSNDLYINSFNTNAALSGTRARIYAPSTFSGGSSFSHWNESTYPSGDPNSLMTPFAGAGEAIHDIGDITRGILRDMGWVLASSVDFDLGIATILSPVSSEGLTNAEAIEIVVGNLGVDAVSNIEVSYSINGGELVTEYFTETIEPGEELPFTFNATADLSGEGDSYMIVASVNYFIDEFEENNSAFKIVDNLLPTPPIVDFPYSESFENGNGNWSVDGSGIWELGSPAGDILNEASDGISAWVTQLSSNYPDATTSSVVSPAFNFDGLQDPIFSFDISYDIETGWDGAALQFSIDDGASWSTVGEFEDETNWYTDGDNRSASSDGSEGNDGIDALTASVNDGDGWTGTGANSTNGYLRASHVVDGAGGEENVIFRIIFASDAGSNNEGFAFDNIEIVSNALEDNDIGIASISSPITGTLTDEETITVSITNFGTSAQSNFDISYQIDDRSKITETFSGSIQPGETSEYSFEATADLSSFRTYVITSSTELSNDAILENNSFEISISNFARITSFPYNESFEEEDHFWSSAEENSSWERVSPTGSIINSASEGSFAFTTNGSGDYNPNEISQLLSPIFDLSEMTNPAISFDIWYETEKSVDGVTLESSVDNGVTWTTIGNLDDLINWYNETNLDLGSQSSGSAWSGSSSQYLKTFNSLSSLASEEFVQLRFLFISDIDIQSEGVSIDNVSIFDEDAIDFTTICTPDQVASNDVGEAFATLSIANPTVTNGSSPTFYNDYTNTVTIDNGVYFIGNTTVNFLVQSGGRYAICSTNVDVEDNEAPVIDCPNEILVAISAGETSAIVDYPLPTFTENFGFPIEVTYQVDRTIDGTSGVGCPNGANAYIRVFDLINDFDINSDYNVQSVDVGFQVAATSGTFDAVANIYTFDGQNLDVNNTEEFVYANFKLVGSSTFTVDLGEGDQLVNVPVSASIPFGQTAVLEVFTEETTATTFPGANPNVTGGRSFLASSACGVPEPLDVRFVGNGFEDSQFTMFLNGSGNSANIQLEFVSGKGSGGEFSIGDNTETYRIIDSFDNETECSFNVQVVESGLDAPIAESSTNALMNSFDANWSSVTGADSYEIFVSDNDFVSTLSEYNGLEISGNSTTINELNANTAYQYRVRAKSQSGSVSQFSNTISTSTLIDSPILNDPLDLTSTGFRIGWSPIQGIKEYEIDISADGFVTFANGFNASISLENQIVITELNPLTTYSVRVRAINSGGKSANSNVVVIGTLAAAPKATPAAEITASSFTAEWDNVDNVAEYSIQVSDDGFNTFVDGFDNIVITENSISVNGLTANVTYIYRIRSISEDKDSEFSNQIRVTTLTNAPVALTPDEVTSYAFKALWEDSPNVLTYELDISQDNFSTFLTGFEAYKVNGNSFLVSELSVGNTYQYRVRAVNRTGIVSGNSNSIEITLPNEAIALDPPIAVDASDIAPFDFIANWNASSGALFYQIEVSEDNFVSVLSDYAGVNVYTTFASIAELSSETEYQYRVRAFNNEGFSEISNTVSVVTLKPLSVIDPAFGGLTIYPNPVSDGKLGLEFSDNSIERFNLSVIDLNGRKLIREDFLNSEVNGFVNLDLSHLSNGTYILKMTTDESSKSYKILVHAK